MSLTGALRTLDAARSHGLRLHLSRLLAAPRIEGIERIEGVEGGATGGEGLRLRGVACGVCATRTEAALASVEGVEAATVDLGSSRATLRLSPGASVEIATLQRALEGAVVGMSMRRRTERVAGRVTRFVSRS
jgi:copper chaperone CopZ